jgi:hypothetical protein
MKTANITNPEMKRAQQAVLRARRRTTVGAFEALLEERSRWQRKATIAGNKLAAVQRRLDALTRELAEARFADDLASLK